MGKKNNSDRWMKRNNGLSIWAVIGVIILVILIFIWLTIADLLGDTGVAA